MKAAYTKTKKCVISKGLGIILLGLCSSSVVVAEELAAIASAGAESAQTQTKAAKPSKKSSEIANGDLGSGRIKAATAKSANKSSEIANGDLGSGRIKAKKTKPK